MASLGLLNWEQQWGVTSLLALEPHCDDPLVAGEVLKLYPCHVKRMGADHLRLSRRC